MVLVFTCFARSTIASCVPVMLCGTDEPGVAPPAPGRADELATGELFGRKCYQVLRNKLFFSNLLLTTEFC